MSSFYAVTSAGDWLPPSKKPLIGFVPTGPSIFSQSSPTGQPFDALHSLYPKTPLTAQIGGDAPSLQFTGFSWLGTRGSSSAQPTWTWQSTGATVTSLKYTIRQNGVNGTIVAGPTTIAASSTTVNTSALTTIGGDTYTLILVANGSTTFTSTTQYNSDATAAFSSFAWGNQGIGTLLAQPTWNWAISSSTTPTSVPDTLTYEVYSDTLDTLLLTEDFNDTSISDYHFYQYPNSYNGWTWVGGNPSVAGGIAKQGSVTPAPGGPTYFSFLRGEDSPYITTNSSPVLQIAAGTTMTLSFVYSYGQGATNIPNSFKVSYGGVQIFTTTTYSASAWLTAEVTFTSTTSNGQLVFTLGDGTNGGNDLLLISSVRLSTPQNPNNVATGGLITDYNGYRTHTFTAALTENFAKSNVTNYQNYPTPWNGWLWTPGGSGGITVLSPSVSVSTPSSAPASFGGFYPAPNPMYSPTLSIPIGRSMTVTFSHALSSGNATSPQEVRYANVVIGTFTASLTQWTTTSISFTPSASTGQFKFAYVGGDGGWCVVTNIVLSEAFTVVKADGITVTSLVVGGGGAGGLYYTGGGGGAGGAVLTASSALTSGSFPVIVGSGGPQRQEDSGGKGFDSSFNSIIGYGGGGGGDWNTNQQSTSASLNGGCGGGSGGPGLGTGTGFGTGSQGGNGGSATAGGQNTGGGGGMGGAGQSTTGTGFGNGGLGASYTIGGTTYLVSGGGGGGKYLSGTETVGGLGGSGIGGNGGTWYIPTGVQYAGTDGATNTGSGGGGSYGNAFPAGNGGSGIVVISYVLTPTTLISTGSLPAGYGYTPPTTTLASTSATLLNAYYRFVLYCNQALSFSNTQKNTSTLALPVLVLSSFTWTGGSQPTWTWTNAAGGSINATTVSLYGDASATPTTLLDTASGTSSLLTYTYSGTTVLNNYYKIVVNASNGVGSANPLLDTRFYAPPTITYVDFVLSTLSGGSATVSVTDTLADSITIQYYESTYNLDKNYVAWGGLITITPATGSDSYTKAGPTALKYYYAVVTAINGAGSTSITTPHKQA